jgi:hypothetical protein
MIRQHGGQRRRGGVNPLGVGVIAAARSTTCKIAAS